VALLALLVFEGTISLLSVFLLIVPVLQKMNGNVFHAVPGLCIEEVHGIMRRGQVAVHAVCYKAMGIVHVGRGFPGFVGELYLMAPGTKLRCCGANHGVVNQAENGKGDDKTDGNKEGWLAYSFHLPLLLSMAVGVAQPIWYNMGK
jgi:hypothetical protein